MNAPRKLTTAISAAILSLTASSAAFASSGATNKVFISGPLILLFLGFCALVVVIQCIPAIITLYGMITGAAASNREKATVSAKNN